jgi:hypothetical protein
MISTISSSLLLLLLLYQDIDVHTNISLNGSKKETRKTAKLASVWNLQFRRRL